MSVLSCPVCLSVCDKALEIEWCMCVSERERVDPYGCCCVCENVPDVVVRVRVCARACVCVSVCVCVCVSLGETGRARACAAGA